MSEIFGQHDEILEMGLLPTVHGHFFTGRRFVTLNLIPGKEYAPWVPQIDSWEKSETLKFTYAGMQPTCSRCHVTDHVFGNCPVMRRQVKLCHVCKSPDHLQKVCPEAWWNERKKAAKLSTAYTSAHQQKPLDKATAHTAPSTALANESTSVIEKATKPFMTAIIPATPLDHTTTDSTNKESSATAEVTVSNSLGEEAGKDATASGEEKQNDGLDAGVPKPDSSSVIQEQQNDNPDDNDTDYMTDDDADDLENTDINMEDAAKEATVSFIPTSTHFNDRIATLDMKFQSFQSIWTSKCAIVNFNRNVYCGHRETTTHMLFICLTDLEIWSNYFTLLFVPFRSLDMLQVAKNVLSYNLSSYRLLDSPFKVSAFEAITCVLQSIWRAKWRNHYDNFGLDNQSVVDPAMASLQH